MKKYTKLIWPFSFYLLVFAAGATFRPHTVLYYHLPGFCGIEALFQGLFNIILGGMTSSIVGFGGGLPFDSAGPRGMYFVFFIFITLVLVAVSVLRRALPPEKEAHQAT